MDDMKLFAKNEKEFTPPYTHTHPPKNVSGDIQWQYRYGIWPFNTESGKQQMTEGIELPNQGKIRTLQG